MTIRLNRAPAPASDVGTSEDSGPMRLNGSRTAQAGAALIILLALVGWAVVSERPPDPVPASRRPPSSAPIGPGGTSPASPPGPGAKETLGAVRAVVSRMREPPPNLEAIMRASFAAVPGLDVHVRVEEPASGDPVRDEALLRCAQEAVTNAVRHGHARNLWIDVSASESGVLLIARDDGRGSAPVRPGNGLLGMRERLEQLGGAVSYRNRAGEGFAIEARLPGCDHHSTITIPRSPPHDHRPMITAP